MNFHTKSADSPRTTLQASLQCDVIGLNAAISACEKAAVFFAKWEISSKKEVSMG